MTFNKKKVLSATCVSGTVTSVATHLLTMGLIFCFALGSPAFAVSIGEEAPLFSLPDFQNDELVDLKKYRGKIVYLDFWASWCLPCRQSFPALSKLSERYSEQGFEVIAVNLDEQPEKAHEFLLSHPVNYSVLKGYGSKISELYNVHVMPTAFFIDGEGVVRVVHLGFKQGHSEYIEAVLQKLLAEL